VHEESPNGGANRRLAGGEQRCVLTSTEGKEMAKGNESLAKCLLLQRADSSPERLDRVRTQAALFMGPAR
jgi:hypothetical protein